MSISIASSSSAAYSEPVQSDSLFPGHIRESGFEIVRLIRLYYDYLNSENQPSQEIARLIANHDIDEMSDKYLSAIQLQIAKTIPNSTVFDKRRLYKIIAQYYGTRGSDHSVQSFFRIFFNEFVNIFYPSSLLFNTSGDKSKSSYAYVLQDSKYWQQFSYEIKSENNPEVWKEAFLKFVHPAGLKLFIAILVFMYSNNTWEGPLSDYINNFEDYSAEEYWKNIKLDQIIHKHSPKFQPNVDYALDYLLRVIPNNEYHYRALTYDIPEVSDQDLYASMLALVIQLVLFPESQTSLFRSDYQTWLKFRDNSAICDGYGECTIEDAMESYLQMNECRFESLASAIEITDPNYLDSFISLGEDSITDWNDSYYNQDEPSTYPIYPGYLPDIPA